MYDYGCVVPLETEARPLIQRLKHKRARKEASRKIYTGTIHNKNITLVISGCGKIKSASATQYLIDHFPAAVYFHFGTAGALSNTLKIGDSIIARCIIEHDVKILFPHKIPPRRYHISVRAVEQRLRTYREVPWVSGTILSGDEDVVSTKRKRALYRDLKGLSVDWESAGFALTCQLNKVKGYIVRVISDYAHEGTVVEYPKNQRRAVMNVTQLLIYLFDTL